MVGIVSFEFFGTDLTWVTITIKEECRTVSVKKPDNSFELKEYCTLEKTHNRRYTPKNHIIYYDAPKISYDASL